MKRVLYIGVIFILLSSCEKALNDFQSHNFIKYFGSGYESVGKDVIPLSDGSYVLTGYDLDESSDKQLLIVKVDAFGNVLWNNTFGSKLKQEEGRVIHEVSDGYVVAGNALINGDTIRSFILKTSETGDSLWYKEFGDPSNFEIFLNDLVVDNENIYVAGYSRTRAGSNTEYYAAKLNLSGEVDWEWKYYEESNSSFVGLFLYDEELLFAGNYAAGNLSLALIQKEDGVPLDFDNTIGSGNENAVDVFVNNEEIYILSNVSEGTKLLKLSSNFELLWETQTLNAISGRAFAPAADGTNIILGESVQEAITLINTIHVSANADTDSESFDMLRGSVEKAKQTSDGGLIFIGATNATFGVKAQLIKTGADLFLLKP